MAHANYTLLKYSRSYSSNDPARLSHQPTSSDHEWQHFSTPKLLLFLEGATADGSFRSARVKIVWLPGGGELHHAQQENITVLEDIDLNSFSHLTTAPKKSQNQSVPLKVVYRDSVVGFRYRHPRIIPSGASPTFRRFQICFTDPLLATQFVDSIRHICPCKANPPLGLVPARTVTAPTDTVAGSLPSRSANNANAATESSLLASQPPAGALTLSTGALMINLQNQPHSVQSPMLPTDLQVQCNVDRSRLPFLETRTSPMGTVDRPTATISNANHSPWLARTLLPSKSSVTYSPEEPGQNIESSGSNQYSGIHARTPSSTAALSTALSDPSWSSGDSTQRHDNLVDSASTTPYDSSKGDVQNCNLSESTAPASQTLVPYGCLSDIGTIEELCAMSTDQLEKLVGEVVREPEFLTLLEKLDMMWKVKGFITNASNEHTQASI